MKKPFYSDVDGVKLDWWSSFVAYNERIGLPLSAPIQRCFMFSDVYPSLGKSMSVLMAHIERFHRSEEFALMEPYPSALQATKELYDDKGVKTTFISSFSDDPVVIRRRQERLSHLLEGRDFELISLGLLACKSRVLNSLPAGIYVDDSPKHCLSALSAGHKAYLRKHPYNEKEQSASLRPVECLANAITDAY